VTVWTLDTCKKPVRNRFFYEKLGYVKEDDSEDEIFYKKIIENNDGIDRAENKDLSKLEYMNCSMDKSDFYSLSLKKSRFTNVNMNEINISDASIQEATVTNVNMAGTLFGDVRMDDIEVCHASIGGAYFHDTNLGWFNEDKPVKFERCDLKGTKIINSDLSNTEIEGCNIKNMKIDGIAVEEMVEFYFKNVIA
jgi:uncharacterized protein YjbI with pentapeptide repeats